MPTRHPRPAHPHTQERAPRNAAPSLWLDHLGAVSAGARRLAHLALKADSALNGSKSNALLKRRTDEEALLRLLSPLIDGKRLIHWAVEHAEALTAETLELFTDQQGLTSWDIDSDDLKNLMRSLLRDRRGLETRLASIDDGVPVSATTRLLVESLSLNDTEAQILDYLYHHEASSALTDLLRQSENVSASINRALLATVLGLPLSRLSDSLSAKAPLRRLGLLEYRTDADLEDYLRPSELLSQIHDAAPESQQALLALLVEPAPAAEWTLEDFPHLNQQWPHIGSVLATSASTGIKGINALFYGEPGTGKTELARALAAAHGLEAYQVKSSDEDGDGLSGTGRLSAYQMAQRLLAQRTRSVLIFDEVEDVFDSGVELFAFLRSRPRSHRKGATNRVLEENPVPAIWISNDIGAIDPAFLRRFLLPLPFHTPPRSVRRQMAEHHLGSLGVSPSLLDQLACDERLMPAQLGAAGQLVKIRNDSDPDAVAHHTISAQRHLLHGAPAPRQRTPATTFDPAFLNLGGELRPAQLLAALQRRGCGSLCFYGPPGTGKTQFTEVLAEALGDLRKRAYPHAG